MMMMKENTKGKKGLNEKGGRIGHGGPASLGRRRADRAKGREETEKKKTERRRESGFYSKRGEGRVWFAELKGFSDDL